MSFTDCFKLYRIDDTSPTYSENFDYESAKFGDQNQNNFIANMGHGTFFKVIKDGYLTQAKAILNCISQGGYFKCLVNVYKTDGTSLEYISSAEAIRSVTSPGKADLWISFDNLYLLEGTYYIALWPDVSTSPANGWQILAATGSVEETEYIEKPETLIGGFNGSGISQSGAYITEYFDHYCIVEILMGNITAGSSSSSEDWNIVTGSSWETGVPWSILKSKEKEIGSRCVYTQEKTFNKPGVVKFTRRIFVNLKETNNQKSKLSFFIDGILKVSWKGIHPWELFDTYFIFPAGEHTFTWIFEIEEEGSYAELGLIEYYKFPPLNDIEIMEYKPGRPEIVMAETSVIDGFSGWQRGAYKGTVFSMKLYIYENDAYLDFIKNLDKAYIWVDELCIPYVGVFVLEDDISKIGANCAYIVSCKLHCPQMAGVGA